MKLTFHRLAIFTAMLFFILAITWMLAPVQLLSGWGVEFTTAAGLVGRRAAALYAGIAVMFFMARNAEPSGTRTALAFGMITVCTLLAFLGVYELAVGHATKGILPAVFIEIALSLAFKVVVVQNRTSTEQAHISTTKPRGKKP